MTSHQIWPYHVTQAKNFSFSYFKSYGPLNFRKSHQMLWFCCSIPNGSYKEDNLRRVESPPPKWDRVKKVDFKKTRYWTFLKTCHFSLRKPYEKCYRFWLRLRHAVILNSNDRTSASKKLIGMALIRTVTVSTTAFERTKEKFYGFPQTDLIKKHWGLNKLHFAIESFILTKSYKIWHH